MVWFNFSINLFILSTNNLYSSLQFNEWKSLSIIRITFSTPNWSLIYLICSLEIFEPKTAKHLLHPHVSNFKTVFSASTIQTVLLSFIFFFIFIPSIKNLIVGNLYIFLLFKSKRVYIFPFSISLSFKALNSYSN